MQVPCFQLSGSQVATNDCGDLGQLEPTVFPGMRTQCITLLLETAVCYAGLTRCLRLHCDELQEIGDC